MTKKATTEPDQQSNKEAIEAPIITKAEREQEQRATEAEKRAKAAEEEIAKIMPFYTDNSSKVYKVVCTKHNGAIAIEAEVKGYDITRGHTENLTVVPVANALLSFRARTDGTMGYACNICDNNSILLSEEEPIRDNPTIPPHIEAKIKEAIAKRGKDYKDTQFTRTKVK